MFIMSLRSQYTGNPSYKNQAKIEAVIIFVTIAGMLVTFLIGYWFGSEVTEDKHPWSISSAGVYSENHSGNDRVAKVKSYERWNGSIVGFAPIEQAVMLHANLP